MKPVEIAARTLPEPVKRVLRPFARVLGWIRTTHATAPDIASELRRITREECVQKTVIAQKKNGPRILILNMRGDGYLLGLEIPLAHRLQMEGAQVSFLACHDLPQCNNRSIDSPTPPSICRDCSDASARLVNAGRMPLHSIADFVEHDVYYQAMKGTSALTAEECFRFEYRGIPVGRSCEVSVARYLCRDAMAEDDLAVKTWRQYVAGGIVLAEAYYRLFDLERPDIIFLCNGDFFWYSIAFEVATRLGVRAVTYESSFRPGECGFGRAWVFCNRGRVSRIDFSEPWKEWKNVELTADENVQLDDSLRAMRKGSMYHPNPIEDRQAVLSQLGLDSRIPIIPLFTNLTWDAAAVGRRTAFRSLREWVEDTVRYASGKPYQLVVRPHPAETMTFEGNRSREAVGHLLKEAFPVLPANVRIVQPHSRISSYTLLEMAPAAIVYTSTLGLEATIQGKPAVIAGGAHYANKGFGYAPGTRAEFFELMDHILELAKPSHEQTELARRYAYLSMFRVNIPLQLFETSSQFQISRFTIDSLDDLMPGRNPYLDLVVEGILKDKSIVLPRELSRRLMSHIVGTRHTILEHQ